MLEAGPGNEIETPNPKTKEEWKSIKSATVIKEILIKLKAEVFQTLDLERDDVRTIMKTVRYHINDINQYPVMISIIPEISSANKLTNIKCSTFSPSIENEKTGNISLGKSIVF